MSRLYDTLETAIIAFIIIIVLWQLPIVKGIASLVALFGLTIAVGGW